MPLSPLQRKAELVLRNITNQQIAKRARCSNQLVSAVLFDRRRNAKVRRHIAKAIERDVAEVFGDTPAAA